MARSCSGLLREREAVGGSFGARCTCHGPPRIGPACRRAGGCAWHHLTMRGCGCCRGATMGTHEVDAGSVRIAWRFQTNENTQRGAGERQDEGQSNRQESNLQPAVYKAKTPQQWETRNYRRSKILPSKIAPKAKPTARRIAARPRPTAPRSAPKINYRENSATCSRSMNGRRHRRSGGR